MPVVLSGALQHLIMKAFGVAHHLLIGTAYVCVCCGWMKARGDRAPRALERCAHRRPRDSPGAWQLGSRRAGVHAGPAPPRPDLLMACRSCDLNVGLPAFCVPGALGLAATRVGGGLPMPRPSVSP